MKIVALDSYGVNPGDLDWKPIAKLGDFTAFDATEREQLAEHARGADAVLVNRLRIGPAELDAMPSLRYIGAFATGYNFIDVKAAAERGITVTNIPAYSTMSVAQATMALLLEVCNHPAHYDSLTRSGMWSGEPGFDYAVNPIVELDGKQMGIIGLGNIGMAVARMAAAFGMRIAAFTSKPQEALPPGFTRMELPELMESSDVVSIHCPLTDATRGLVSARMIALMKPSAILINTARGAITDEQALADALREGRIAGAGIDVPSKEPPADGNPLLSAPRCFITPHVAWASREARTRSIEGAAANLRAFIEGHPINKVN